MLSSNLWPGTTTLPRLQDSPSRSGLHVPKSTLFLGLTASIFSWPTIYIGTRIRSARTVKKRGAWLCSFFLTFPSHLQIFGLIACARILTESVAVSTTFVFQRGPP
ncbi:hypothetical protein BGY98DRAFT_79828 [Russula aff. rugulosa BPL654]|nr:hypothetical protein BGY98DRAFT_79828 [Russula aff. rugulosa BPL654]